MNVFPDSSAGKESTCNVGDLGSITGLGRSPGEEKGYPLQHSGLENSMGCKESDMTEQLPLSLLPASCETCIRVKKQELELDTEQWTGSRLGKEYIKAINCHLAYLTSVQSTS